jgi:ribonuclease R
VLFRSGDKVRVRVVRVDLDEAKIDFELVGSTAAKTKSASSHRTQIGKRQGRRTGKRTGKPRR